MKRTKLICAAGVNESTGSYRESNAGLTPSAALHELRLQPISLVAAKHIIIRNHYLHSFPGGTKLHIGVFLGTRLLGALTLGVGPFLGYKIVRDAEPTDVITLTRLWLSDELPSNTESKVLGILLRELKKSTNLKFVLAYSDPAAGHVGTIYQGTNWFYIGLSSATPLYDIGDGKLHYSRSLAHQLGSHSMKYWNSKGLAVKTIPQMAKHKYIYFLDESWRSRLAVPELPFPKKEGNSGNHGNH